MGPPLVRSTSVPTMRVALPAVTVVGVALAVRELTSCWTGVAVAVGVSVALGDDVAVGVPLAAGVGVELDAEGVGVGLGVGVGGFAGGVLDGEVAEGEGAGASAV